MHTQRFERKTLTLNRLLFGLSSRLNEFPHTLAWFFSSQARENKHQIKKFHNIHQGKRCFIVANGPSLNQTDLSLLKNEISFGLNRIYLNFSRSSFRPSYYVAVNELVLDQYAAEIAELGMHKFINWNRRSLFHCGDQSITYIKSKLVHSDFFQSDLTKPMVFGGTVTFAALQLAYYMGFQQVFLVGLDHFYHEKGTPNQSEIRAPRVDTSHFHPGYFPQGSKWQLPDLFRSEVDYRIARYCYERDGREIFDATVNGHCQIFEKVNLKSLF